MAVVGYCTARKDPGVTNKELFISPRGNPFWSNADEWHFTKDGDEVPKEVYLRLSLKTHVGCTSTYVSIAEAYRDLITAYVAARRTGWRPEARTP